MAYETTNQVLLSLFALLPSTFCCFSFFYFTLAILLFFEHAEFSTVSGTLLSLPCPSKEAPSILKAV